MPGPGEVKAKQPLSLNSGPGLVPCGAGPERPTAVKLTALTVKQLRSQTFHRENKNGLPEV